MCHVRVCSVVKLGTIENVGVEEGRRHRSLEEEEKEEEKVWEERERR